MNRLLTAVLLLFPPPAVQSLNPDMDAGEIELRVEPSHPLEMIREISEDSEIDGTVVDEARKKKNRTRLVTAVAATVCVVSGAAAHYYMSEATDSYDSYLHSGNPKDMNRHFSKTESLDLKAGYSLAVFEISFFVALLSFIDSLEE